jgi:hypothetical protein
VTQLPGGEIVPAMERGVIDAFEFNNPTSDMRFGAQDVAKNYMMGSYHQASEFFEIIFNKGHAVEAVNSSNFWLAMENYSRDLQILRTSTRSTCTARRTASINAQLVAWDKLITELSKDPSQQEDSRLAASLVPSASFLRAVQRGQLPARLRARTYKTKLVLIAPGLQLFGPWGGTQGTAGFFVDRDPACEAHDLASSTASTS